MLKSNVIKQTAGIVLSVLVTVAVVSVVTVHASEKQDRKIVVFKNSIDRAKKNALLKKHGVEKIKELQSINGVVVKLSKENKLKDENEIAYIEDDLIISISKKPEKDPVETPPPPVPEVIPWGIEWMCAPDYWGQTDTDNVKVAIIDTGIDLDHPDLKDNIKGGFNALKKNKPANDDNGHGTHIAGIVAAVDNDIGVIGMAPDADLYAVKVLDSSGNGYVSDVIEGIDWAINNDIDILNMSVGTVNHRFSWD
jgi:subtilisin